MAGGTGHQVGHVSARGEGEVGVTPGQSPITTVGSVPAPEHDELAVAVIQDDQDVLIEREPRGPANLARTGSGAPGKPLDEATLEGELDDAAAALVQHQNPTPIGVESQLPDALEPLGVGSRIGDDHGRPGPNRISCPTRAFPKHGLRPLAAAPRVARPPKPPR